MMSLSPWYQGMLSPAWKLSLTTESGNADLTGVSASALSLQFHNLASGIATIGAGTFSIVQASPAIVQYQLATNDVLIPGKYEVSVIVAYTNGPALYGPIEWHLLPL